MLKTLHTNCRSLLGVFTPLRKAHARVAGLPHREELLNVLRALSKLPAEASRRSDAPKKPRQIAINGRESIAALFARLREKASSDSVIVAQQALSEGAHLLMEEKTISVYYQLVGASIRYLARADRIGDALAVLRANENQKTLPTQPWLHAVPHMAMIDVYLSRGEQRQALEVYDAARERGITASQGVYQRLLRGYLPRNSTTSVPAGGVDMARITQLFGDMVQRSGVVPTAATLNILLHLYLLANDRDRATAIVNILRGAPIAGGPTSVVHARLNASTASLLIGAAGSWDEVEGAVTQLLDWGVVAPDMALRAIEAADRMGALGQVRGLVLRVEKGRALPQPFFTAAAANLLVEKWARAGEYAHSMSAARALRRAWMALGKRACLDLLQSTKLSFEQVRATWDFVRDAQPSLAANERAKRVLISAYGRVGRIDLVTQMANTATDARTFAHGVAVIARSGRVEQALRVLEMAPMSAPRSERAFLAVTDSVSRLEDVRHSTEAVELMLRAAVLPSKATTTAMQRMVVRVRSAQGRHQMKTAAAGEASVLPETVLSAWGQLMGGMRQPGAQDADVARLVKEL